MKKLEDNTDSRIRDLRLVFAEKISRPVWKLLGFISPRLNTIVMNWRIHKKPLNLKRPRTFNEKLLWLKLNDYNKNSLVRDCSDKFAVRAYVRRCGHAAILNELYEKFESVDDVPWSELKDQFALKWNFGCGLNLICHDKSTLDIEVAKNTLRRMGKTRYWLNRGELFYKPLKKWLLYERYLGTTDGTWPDDFKFYCFNGVPATMLYACDRDTHLKFAFVDMEWNYMSGAPGYAEVNELPPKPKLFEDMVKIAADLCKPFPFVRIDLYSHDNNIVFGEMSFMPFGGHHQVETTINRRSMGDLLSLPNRYSSR